MRNADWDCGFHNQDPQSVFRNERCPVVEVQSATINIQELRIERPAIVAYLKAIAPDKQEIALVHALEVGVTELALRRERFQR
jgi:hypothetical protein